jgi:chemotaxis protein histidine kinase CheA
MIVEKLGGHIAVAGSENMGAMFQIQLPLAIQWDGNGIDK